MTASPQLVSLENAPLEIIDGDRGKHYPKQHEFSEAGFCLFLNAGNVTKSGFNFDTCLFINESKDRLLRKGRLCRDDIVMTTRGTLGNMAYFSEGINFENIRINSGMVLIRAHEADLRPQYLYCALRSSLVSDQINQLKSGVAQPQLPIRDLKKIKIPMPVPDVQDGIANLIGAYDLAIANNNNRIELLERSARLFFEEWFVRLRYPGHEHDKIVEGVPNGWDSGTVQDFYNTASGGTPSRNVPEFFDDGTIPWVKTQELNSGFILETQERITQEAVAASAAKVFPKGTVLVAMYGATIGETAILGVDAATNQACCALLPRDGRANSAHAFIFFLTNQRGLVSLSQGAAQNNVSQAVIRQYPMMMPPRSVMATFVDFAMPILEQHRVLQNQMSSLVRARDLLLPRLMDGRIEV